MELGCGIGVSTRYMRDGAPPNAKIIGGVDYNRGRLDYASESFEGDNEVSFVFSDVIEFLKSDTSMYDLIFIDSMKKQYPIVFYYALKRLNEGGDCDLRRYFHVW